MRKLSLFLISLGFVYFLQFGSENEYGSEVALPYAASAEEASEEKTVEEVAKSDESSSDSEEESGEDEKPADDK